MLQDFLKQLRKLPYADMMVVTRAMESQLKGGRSTTAVELAESLIHATRMPLANSPSTDEEMQLLRELFNRERSISVKKQGTGWTVSISTLGNASATHTDLREALIQLLDTLIVAKALSK